MTTWFTSDLHIGHRNILQYCPNRPFRTVEEHDDGIIGEWCDKVAPHDDVYFLGDLTLDADPERCLQLLEKLPGQIHVVLGNHDRALKKVRRFQFAEDCRNDTTAELHLTYAETLGRLCFMERTDRVEGFYRFRLDGISCVLNHHPLEDWPGMALHGRAPRADVEPLSGRWHLHGHSHGASRAIPARLDVGWDTANKILSWEDVKRAVHGGRP